MRAARLAVNGLPLLGGPLLYLGLQIWYLRGLTGRVSRPRLHAAVLLVVPGGAATGVPAIVALALSTALVGLLALRVTGDDRRTRSAEPES